MANSSFPPKTYFNKISVVHLSQAFWLNRFIIIVSPNINNKVYYFPWYNMPFQTKCSHMHNSIKTVIPHDPFICESHPRLLANALSCMTLTWQEVNGGGGLLDIWSHCHFSTHVYLSVFQLINYQFCNYLFAHTTTDMLYGNWICMYMLRFRKRAWEQVCMKPI